MYHWFLLELKFTLIALSEFLTFSYYNNNHILIRAFNPLYFKIYID